MGQTLTREDNPQWLPGWFQPLVPVALAFAVGITGDRWAFSPECGSKGVLSGYTILGLVGLLAAWGWGFHTRVSRWTLLFVFALAGATEHHIAWRYFSPRDVGLFAGEWPHPVALRAVVTSVPEALARPEPDPFELFAPQPAVRFTVRVTAIRWGQDWEPAAGRLLVYLACPNGSDGGSPGEAALVQFLPGENIEMFGQLRRPSPAENAGDCDMRTYRRGDRILAELSVPYPQCVIRLAPAFVGNPQTLLGWWRLHAAQTLREYLSRENKPLAQALLLGFRTEIPDELEKSLLETGTIHLLAISGLHLGILVGVFNTFFRTVRVPHRLRVGLLLAVIGVYVAISGGQPSTIRAATTFSVLLLGTLFYRSFWSLNALTFAALVILVWNPAALFRPGPQLSFLAASVLIMVGRRYFVGTRGTLPSDLPSFTNPQRFAWREVFAKWLAATLVITVGIWVISWPLAWYSFHIISPLGIVLTPVLIPLITGVLAAGFGLLFVGPLWSGGAWPLAWVCDGCLTGCRWLIQQAEHTLPLYTWQPAPPTWWVAGVYAWWILLVLGSSRNTRRLTQFSWAGLGGWLLGGVVFLFFPAAQDTRSPHDLRMTVLSVGHGLGIVIEAPDGQVWLYDLGSLGGADRAGWAATGTLFSRGLRRLDGVLLSHADLDHYNGLPELCQYIAVEQVVVTPKMFQAAARREPGVRALEELITRRKLRLRTIKAGDTWWWGSCHVTVLHPPRDSTGLTDNAASLALCMEYAGRRILLTGDLEGPGLQALLNRPPISVDILVAPHHGTARSRPDKLLQWCRPRYVVISGGWASLSNTAGFTTELPSEDDDATTVREVFHTAEVGAVTVTISPDGRTYLSGCRSTTRTPNNHEKGERLTGPRS
ncbi:ComEC/Rec2 family competence protein [Thermogutta sp.]|uniref:ComEC/Rec2 family competence protein n=1 Tax=Thermogutta sp. TaxID=1962930 RepID=UPI003220724C